MAKEASGVSPFSEVVSSSFALLPVLLSSLAARPRFSSLDTGRRTAGGRLGDSTVFAASSFTTFCFSASTVPRVLRFRGVSDSVSDSSRLSGNDDSSFLERVFISVFSGRCSSFIGFAGAGVAG